MKKILLITMFVLFSFVGGAIATPMTLSTGTSIMLIDGNDDVDVNVMLDNFDVGDGYFLQYNVNGGDWHEVAGTNAGWDLVTLLGGDVIDFSLLGPVTQSQPYNRYTLSEDLNDARFSVTMMFDGELSAANSQQPVLTHNYYDRLMIDWIIEDPALTTISKTFIVNSDHAANDGFAPVPEPGTFLLLGSGLIGLAYLKRRKS